MIGPFGGSASVITILLVAALCGGVLLMLLGHEFDSSLRSRTAWWGGIALIVVSLLLLGVRVFASGTLGPFGGSADALAMTLLAGGLIGLLFVLLAYEFEHWGPVALWVGLGLSAVAVPLLIFGRPGPAVVAVLSGAVIVWAAGQVAPQVVLRLAPFQAWGHVAWWVGIALLVLSVLLLGFGRPASAIAAVIAGTVILWILAQVMPQVPIRYSHWEEQPGEPEAQVTGQDLAWERRRYGVLAIGTVVVAGIVVLVGGGIPVPETGAEAVPGAEVTVEENLVERGQALFQQFGCVACHATTAATAGVGPSLSGKFGRQEQLVGGGTVLVDEAYVRESILQPNAKIVRGFQAEIMVGAIGPRLETISKEENLKALVAFIKSLQ